MGDVVLKFLGGGGALVGNPQPISAPPATVFKIDMPTGSLATPAVVWLDLPEKADATPVALEKKRRERVIPAVRKMPDIVAEPEVEIDGRTIDRPVSLSDGVGLCFGPGFLSDAFEIAERHFLTQWIRHCPACERAPRRLMQAICEECHPVTHWVPVKKKRKKP